MKKKFSVLLGMLRKSVAGNILRNFSSWVVTRNTSSAYENFSTKLLEQIKFDMFFLHDSLSLQPLAGSNYIRFGERKLGSRSHEKTSP